MSYILDAWKSRNLSFMLLNMSAIANNWCIVVQVQLIAQAISPIKSKKHLFLIVLKTFTHQINVLCYSNGTLNIYKDELEMIRSWPKFEL